MFYYEIFFYIYNVFLSFFVRSSIFKQSLLLLLFALDTNAIFRDNFNVFVNIVDCTLPSFPPPVFYTDCTSRRRAVRVSFNYPNWPNSSLCTESCLVIGGRIVPNFSPQMCFCSSIFWMCFRRCVFSFKLAGHFRPFSWVDLSWQFDVEVSQNSRNCIKKQLKVCSSFATCIYIFIYTYIYMCGYKNTYGWMMWNFADEKDIRDNREEGVSQTPIRQYKSHTFTMLLF